MRGQRGKVKGRDTRILWECCLHEERESKDAMELAENREGESIAKGRDDLRFLSHTIILTLRLSI